VVADLIHHDPLVYRTLDEAGLPQVGQRKSGGDGVWGVLWGVGGGSAARWMVCGGCCREHGDCGGMW
jgi:hypothetical protein